MEKIHQTISVVVSPSENSSEHLMKKKFDYCFKTCINKLVFLCYIASR